MPSSNTYKSHSKTKKISSYNLTSPLPHRLPSNNITYLSLTNTNLTTYPTYVNKLPLLKILNLNFNKINNITALPPSIKELYASYNIIAILPQDLYKYNTLSIISLNNNKLIVVPNLPNKLEELYLNNNLIIGLPFIPLSLKILSIANNKLCYLPSQFTKNHHITYAAFNHNTFYQSPQQPAITSFEKLAKFTRDLLKPIAPHIGNNSTHRHPPIYEEKNSEIITQFLLNKMLPKQLRAPFWEIGRTSIDNSMDYIFNYLHHPCYLVGVKNHEIFFYKLVPNTGTSPLYLSALKSDLNNINNNPTLLENQIKDIKTATADNIDNIRIMQCILKTFKQEQDKLNKKNEYHEFLDTFADKLNDGIFIFNLTDAHIIPEGGNAPSPLLPIFSGGGGQQNYIDIPIPNYDEIMRLLSNGGAKAPLNIPWQKKINKAIFRGGPSGCGTTSLTNPRMKLAVLSKYSPLNKYVDACIIGHHENNAIKFDTIFGLSKIHKPSIYSSLCSNQSPIPMHEQAKYKFIIHVDGNVNAHRLLNTMLTGSLILRVKSKYTHWADHFLQAGVHFIEIDESLNNLYGVIEWCLLNDATCSTIANNGRIFATILTQKYFIQQIFIKYLNYFNKDNATDTHRHS